ncbi:MAG: DNA helicase [Micrococcales bacterium]|nr:MAG: DNA helicase [Micrococcales bacterium]
MKRENHQLERGNDRPGRRSCAAAARGGGLDSHAHHAGGRPMSGRAATDAEPAADLTVEQTFAELGVSGPIVAALEHVGIVRPFPVQTMTLPIAMARHDIIGQAKTGTGKTLGFGIPLLEHTCGPGEPGWTDLADAGKPQAVVIAPARELAVQVATEIQQAAAKRSVRVLQVYGGRAYEPQVAALQRGVEVVVGTPGRMLDLSQQGHLDLSHVRTLVLDEADQMLDLGFLPDVESLLAQTPAGRHTMLFSATMPGPVVALARRYMDRPTHVRVHSADEDSLHVVDTVKQVVYRAHALDKTEVLARLLQAEGRGLTIVFVRTKRTAAKVADELSDRGFAAASIHGDLGQGAREQALRAFRNSKVDVLVATDVAARGIDVDDVTHVVNYQSPEDEKTYLHRIGRTARAGKEGTAVTFVDWDEIPRWTLIDKALGIGIPEPVETYSTSEHLFTDLGIPPGTTGRLPRAHRTRAGLNAEEVEDLGETGRHAGHAKGTGRAGGRSGRDGLRQQRRRRRTRGGKDVTRGSATASGAVLDSDGSTGSSTSPPAEATTETGRPTTQRRRRRRHGGE